MHKPIDARILVYRFMRLLFLALVVGFLIKTVLFETRVIATDQMHPSLYQGDRILVSKLGVLNPFTGKKSLREGKIALLKPPGANDGEYAGFRIAATAGDTVAVVNGTITVNSSESKLMAIQGRKSAPLPAQYSPRDAIAPFLLPACGDSVSFSGKSPRDLVFYVSMIRQETQSDDYALQATLVCDSSDTSDYILKDFTLYTGSFSAIPDSLRYNWFFWDRLIEYFHTFEHDNERFEIKLAIVKNGKSVSGYRYLTDHYFFVADNWEAGYDSRFFGPVSRKNIQGLAACILWSQIPSKGIKGFRPQRVGKIIGAL